MMRKSNQSTTSVMTKHNGEQHQHGRQHDELALGEVDRLRGLPDQREADRSQRIDRARGDAGNEISDEFGHGCASLEGRASL